MVTLLLLCGLATALALPQFDDFELDLCGANKIFDENLDKCIDVCTEDKVYDDKVLSCVDICESDETYKDGKCEKKPCLVGETFDLNLNKCIKRENCKPIDEITAEVEVDLRNQVNDNCKERKCSDYKHLGFRCVPTHVCLNRTIISDGQRLIDIRTTDDVSNNCCAEIQGVVDVSESKCDRVVDVCCRDPDVSLKTCGVHSGCPNSQTKRQPIPEDEPGCGQVVTDFQLRLINSSNPDFDQDTQPGELPHMCLVYRKINNQNVFLGGASLIDRNKVLTVAHKFVVKRGKDIIDIENDPQIHVRCGEHDVKLKTPFLEHQESRVKKVHIDPDYDMVLLKNNLAILETEKNFIYQKHIGPVCLPKPNESFEGMNDCISSGWGTSSFENGLYSDSLKKVQLSVMDRASCQAAVNNVDRVKKAGGFEIYPSWICVGGQDGDDTCTGDGGSPHVCKVNNRYVQVHQGGGK